MTPTPAGVSSATGSGTATRSTSRRPARPQRGCRDRRRRWWQGCAAEQGTCPQGAVSASWGPCAQRGTPAIVVKFPAEVCRTCPARGQCTTATRGGRQLTVRPRQIHQALDAARAEQHTKPWQATYALRAVVEGTIKQAVAVTGIRRARYRGLPKTHLEHTYAAVALNLLRLDAWWNGHPLDRTRISHLTRLQLALAA